MDDEEQEYFTLLDLKKNICIGETFKQNYEFDSIININPEVENKLLPNKVYNFIIKNNDSILFDCIEFVVELVICQKSIFIIGCGKNIYIFIMCFLRRWNKYTFQKSLDLTEVFYKLKFPSSKLKFNRFELNQLQRYEPPLSVFMYGDGGAHREYDSIIELELKKLPKKSIIYIGTFKGVTKGVCSRIKELSKKLEIELEEIPITEDLIERCNGDLDLATFIRNKNILDSGVDVVLVFHPDIEHSSKTLKMAKEARNKKIDVYTFDLKIKEKYEF